MRLRTSGVRRRLVNLFKTNRAADHWFYLLILPLAWAGCSLLHFRHPGDEYAMYALSSLPGSWVLLVSRVDIHSLLAPLSVAVTGALVMAVVGCFLAWLKVKKVLWATLFGVFSFAILLLMVGSFGSVERALSKNGSWWAYICSAIELGMYVASVSSVLLTGAARLWCRLKSR